MLIIFKFCTFLIVVVVIVIVIWRISYFPTRNPSMVV